MPNLTFVKIRSWHIVRNPGVAPNSYRTLCGRNGDGPPVETLPAERSCESCLRSSVRISDR